MQPSGIPDIVGVYKGMFFGVESKEPGNATSKSQDFRIGRIRDAGGFVVIAYSMTDVQQFLLHLAEYHTPGRQVCRGVCPYAQQ